MSELEVLAVALGVLNITLLIRRSIWNFPFGLAMVSLYFVIFWQTRLYSDALLQIFFFGVQLVGWAAWARSGGLQGPVVVERLQTIERWLWPAGVAVATLFWGWAMAVLTNAAAPWWDAAVAMGSVASQLLLVRRKMENWLGWIIVNILAIGLYWTRGLQPTAALYVFFLIMCVAGWREWRRAWNAGKDRSGATKARAGQAR